MVTGGAGFIGSHVADALLAAGHEVGVIDDLSTGSRDNLPATVPLHVIDIRDRDAVFAAFAAFRPEVVCHQAAQMSVSRSVREPLFDAEVNTIGLINVLDAAVAQKCGRVVFASSGGVLYGEQTSPAPEETPADPVSRLEADDSVARQSKCPCGRDTRRPCADDNDVKVKHRTLDSHLVPRSIGLTLMKSGEK